MKNLIGVKWGSLDEQTREKLLLSANCIDGVTGNNITKDGECIVDLTDKLSICGKCINDEIVIDDDAEIYSPCD